MKTTSERRDPATIVRIEGKIIRENQAELRAKLEELMAAGALLVALDLDKVEYMDSSALGCCASVQKSLRERAGLLVVFGASPNVEKMWKLIRLDLVIPLLADEKEAIARLRAVSPPAPSP